MPRPGPGFDSIMNRIDLPLSAASATPSGPSTPWLMALLRNSTLAGSTMTDASGSRLWLTSLRRRGRPLGDVRDDRADAVEADDGHRAADDADAEVVDQHLEAGLDLALDEPVEQLEDVRGRAGR